MTPGITSVRQLSPDPTCREVIEFIRAYLDGELPASERATFEAHLRLCESCVAYIETYRASIAMARLTLSDAGADAPPVPKGLADAIMRSVRRAHEKSD